MKTKETIELELKAIDFKDTDYINNNSCAVSKAVSRQLGVDRDNIIECVDWVYLGEDLIEYDHVHYGVEDFNLDQITASNAKPNQTIRILTLTKNTKES